MLIFSWQMAQIYYDALGKQGAMGFIAFLFIVQYLMGYSITIAASRQMWAFSRDGALPFSSFFRRIVSLPCSTMPIQGDCQF
jgi:amino acid transporter